MAWYSRDKVDPGARSGSGPLLEVSGLDVYYGRAHALQAVGFTLDHGVLGIVGRNGMGKTTLCNAITGLVKASGSIRFAGEEILGLAPHQITRRGIAYVPQGRRIWPSLTVDETLRLVASHRREVERVYTMFPRLAERRSNGGAQLSGGEQQMLAIGRALLLEPRLLVMDEPTEGLAPAIVEQVAQALRALSGEREVSVLLIEQNLGVAIDVADRIGVMVNGRLAHQMPAHELAGDTALQERLLGMRASGAEEANAQALPQLAEEGDTVQVFTVRRAHADPAAPVQELVARTAPVINRWDTAPSAAPARVIGPAPAQPRRAEPAPSAQVLPFNVATGSERAAYVAGTFDTKSRDLFFLRQCLEKLGLRVVTVDLSTSGRPSAASVHPREVARHHPQGEQAVFTGDRGSSVTGMALAFEHFIRGRRDLGGLIGAGGSGGTTLVSAGMRALPVGVPKVLVSTMASGDTRAYVGPSDICMMYSVTDVAGINRISGQVLSNAAHALAGMIAHPAPQQSVGKPALGLTMFGVTTPCVQAVTRLLEDEYDCLVFHATGVGGQSMEKLADSGLLAGAVDVSTTEIADEVVGGVLSAGPTRLDVFARAGLPYVGSCGALDMVNFGTWDSVPARFRGRNLVPHNPNVTLMRTTADECKAIGEFIAAKLNAMNGPVHFLLPEAGVSALDRAGQPFHDPAADRALFLAIEQNFRAGPRRKLQRLPLHVNDEAFAQALAAAWRALASTPAARAA